MARRKGLQDRRKPDAYSLRLDPRLRFAAELAAEKERRTLASLIEWAIDQAVRQISVVNQDERLVSALKVSQDVWNEDEVVRFLLLAKQYPTLLTVDQHRLRDLIFRNPLFSTEQSSPVLKIDVEKVREHWETLNKFVAGKLPRSKLPWVSDEMHHPSFEKAAVMPKAKK